MLSRTTVAIPFHKRIVFVCFLNCPEFAGRLSKISQAHNAISGIQFHASGGWLCEQWPLGAVRVRNRPGVRRGGWGDLRNFRIGLLRFIFHFAVAFLRPFVFSIRKAYAWKGWVG